MLMGKRCCIGAYLNPELYSYFHSSVVIPFYCFLVILCISKDASMRGKQFVLLTESSA